MSVGSPFLCSPGTFRGSAETLKREEVGTPPPMDTTEAFVLDSLRFWPQYAAKIDTIAFTTLDNLYNCPTVNREYIISANNDTIPKMIDIHCPLDSTDQEALNQDFKTSFLGGLKIENHGSLENGEKTW